MSIYPLRWDIGRRKPDERSASKEGWARPETISLGEKRMDASKLRLRTALIAVLTLLAALAWLPACVHSQEDWKKRDQWQRPAEVMDELGVRRGGVVADVGAGGGYFTFRLAERVGTQGKVYAEDIADDRLAEIRNRAKKEGPAQITTVLGAADDPHLPAESLDVVLVVNAYHEMKQYDAMLQGMYRALKPSGRLGVIDHEDVAGKPRKTYQDRHTVPQEFVREDALRNSFRFLRQAPGFTNADGAHWFFLIFEKPES
jgi:predicted methyltransferase